MYTFDFVWKAKDSFTINGWSIFDRISLSAIWRFMNVALTHDCLYFILPKYYIFSHDLHSKISSSRLKNRPSTCNDCIFKHKIGCSCSRGCIRYDRLITNVLCRILISNQLFDQVNLSKWPLTNELKDFEIIFPDPFDFPNRIHIYIVALKIDRFDLDLNKSPYTYFDRQLSSDRCDQLDPRHSSSCLFDYLCCWDLRCPHCWPNMKSSVPL